MKSQKGWFDWAVVGIVVCIGLILFAIVSTGMKQSEDHKKFMAGCLQDKKQYECDVLWNQTAESKQNRDLAIGLAAGAAIGAAGSRR